MLDITQCQLLIRLGCNQWASWLIISNIHSLLLRKYSDYQHDHNWSIVRGHARKYCLNSWPVLFLSLRDSVVSKEKKNFEFKPNMFKMPRRARTAKVRLCPAKCSLIKVKLVNVTYNHAHTSLSHHVWLRVTQASAHSICRGSHSYEMLHSQTFYSD